MTSSNSSNGAQNSSKTYKYECLDCENYKRKVVEAEHTVSGRDVLIEMLQAEIKKMEDRYKASIDDYEMLRFKYCTVVQDLSNLREIHKKLEKSSVKVMKERDIAKNQLEIVQCEVEKWQKQCKEFQNQLLPTGDTLDEKSSAVMHQNILKEVMNIEILMQNQNETVRDVLLKVLKEMKDRKGCRQLEEMLQKSPSSNGQIEEVEIKKTEAYRTYTKNQEDAEAVITDLTNQIEVLKILVEKLKAENESIKNQLTEKKTNLTQCLSVLEDNHSNLNNLSGNIEMIINEKEMYLNEIGKLKEIIEDNNELFQQKDDAISELKRKVNEISQQPDGDLKKENERLQKQLKHCNEELEQLQEDFISKATTCSVDTCTQMAKAILEAKAAQTVSRTCNSAVASDLEKNINEARKQAEECEKILKQRIEELEAERDTYKHELEQYEQYKNENEEIKSANSVAKQEYRTEIISLNEKIKLLECDLEQAKLENSEYEEENKYYCQKGENLLIQLDALEKEKMELENSVAEISQRFAELKQRYEALNSEKETEIKQLKNELNTLRRTDSECELEDRIMEMQKELDTANEEKTRMIEEKEHLKKQIINLQNEITHIQETDEKQILKLQDKIDNMENTQSDKQNEIIDECCCVVQNLKKTIANKNFIDDNKLAELRVAEDQKLELQKDNEQLKEQINTLKNELSSIQEHYKGCNCNKEDSQEEISNLEAANEKLQNDMKIMEIELCRRDCLNEKLQNDIKQMEIEICRRQCAINHLEQCLDKSNKILEECEREMKDMIAEIEELKKQNESLRNDLQTYATEVESSEAEKNEMREKVTRANRQSQQLEIEKHELTKNLENMSNVEEELEEMKKMYNDLAEKTREKERMLRTANQQIEDLQQDLEESKKEHDKIKQLYKDMQETLSEEIKKYNRDIETINTENVKVNLKVDSKCPLCLDVEDLNAKIKEKEKTIESLQKQNRELASEVAELKTYVNKVVSDNKRLRIAVDSLIATLAQKLKVFTESEETICLKSNESMVRDILQSLMNLENVIQTNNSTSTGKCNCMSIITSTYNNDGKDPKPRHMPGCKMKCGRKIKDTCGKSTGCKSSNEILNACENCCTEKEKNVQNYEQGNSSCCSNTGQDKQSEPYIIESEDTR